MTYHSRRWSVMPARAVGDRELKERELRVLGALCIFANRAGVCWPAMETLCNITGFATRQSIHDALKVLKRRKYVRRLQPKDYQETSSGWSSNRYQVLWDGDEPLPTYEDIDNAKPLQVRADDDAQDTNVIGGVGDEQVNTHTTDQPEASAIAHAYIRAVQQATGQVRLYDNEIAHARRLAVAGYTAADVSAATLNVCDAALERRAGVPSLYDVAQGML
jgi:hypothetical protein